jgi:hypothetical protein
MMVSKADQRYYDAQERKRKRMMQLRDDQASGLVADSDAVRVALIKRMHAGELTLEQVQAEIKRIQREAKKAGRPVRADYFKR